MSRRIHALAEECGGYIELHYLLADLDWEFAAWNSALLYFWCTHSQIGKNVLVLTKRFRVIRQPKPRSALKAKLYK